MTAIPIQSPAIRAEARKPTRDDTRTIGRHGEAIAAEYLMRSGYEIIAMNWQIWGGEIDIVADQDGTIVFVEVKFRKSNRGGTAQESLSHLKKVRLRRSAELFLLRQHIQHFEHRFDFIAIDRLSHGYRLAHFKNIELDGSGSI